MILSRGRRYIFIHIPKTGGTALALALDASQRTVQRALADHEAEGRVRASGQTRARRWLAPPLAGFTTILLLPSTLAIA